MSVSQDFYPFACDHCNYEASAKSQKSLVMLKRLHRKKCTKVGRSEQSGVMADTKRRWKIFADTHKGGQGARFVPTNETGDGNLVVTKKDGLHMPANINPQTVDEILLQLKKAAEEKMSEWQVEDVKIVIND